MGIELDLELPDVEILSVSRDNNGDYVIELRSTKKSGVCRKCGKKIRHFRGYDQWIMIRHLPILGREVYLKIRPRRYQCLDCDNEPTTTERFPWRAPGKSYTKTYQDHVLQFLINSNIKDVCLKERLGEKHIESKKSWAVDDYKQLKGLLWAFRDSAVFNLPFIQYAIHKIWWSEF
ncbi:zinc-finger of transposase IS204/IS1001/IS1096/IS1165 [Desulfocicer vacuolatum DSM 3385]|uniref:Zinc-finger of transposase IS204/IS1001/IS1096/IS1165 n=1 Tax=Desulfocicer vacuolatum DSM 3385 TaxID=1121400 RepID=A0A1W2BZU3_9BACT|nr:transposase family protein [Desulfocicer vacuolatum]SMC78346.1 zinc-finger of transposase IS204/IS1001/IS1096/IS1165 [Desulfocicer vacuolatum DSM 3385]